jgi:hypothetical protein
MNSPARWPLRSAAALPALLVAAWCVRAADDGPAARPPVANQALMRDKLKHAQQVVEGLALGDFAKLETAGKTMALISRAAAWQVEPTDDYRRYSMNFQEQARDLERHARERNLDACVLDQVRLTASCVDCHRHLRALRAAGR